MTKDPDIRSSLSLCVALFFLVFNVHASEQLLEASIDTRVEVNDNIFLTDLPHDTVQGIVITPALAGLIKETSWEAKLKAEVRSYNYSDPGINSNDQYFDLTGRYRAERNIFSLNTNYDLASNLRSTSTNFGVVGRRINSKNQSITPQYTRLLNERSTLILSYTYRDIAFLEAENTGFLDYTTEAGSGTLRYDLTEKDKFTVSLTVVDYASKDELVTYQLFTSLLGIDHKFTETLSADFSMGVSRRDSTNKQTQSFDFLGQPIVVSQSIDAKNRGLVLDAGITQLLENGNVSGRVSRDNRADSFGGLNQIDKFKAGYTNKLSALWRYNINARFDDVTAIGATSGTRDRQLFAFDAIARYSITNNWNANASYRYVIRKFKNDVSGNRAPSSNRIYVGLTYNFPSLSTF